MTACLLGPLSRRRFGQNQRSLFAFLNSAEPQGFRDFLATAGGADLYGPDRLWDYLRLNLEPSILASPDGRRWALAADVLERCEARGGGELHERLLKVIALADLLKARSRLPASRALLECALPDQLPAAIKAALDELTRWSLIVFRRFADAWGVFEGSDFDIEKALEQARPEIEGRESEILRRVGWLKPMLAKRHYDETGALRWFDLGIAPLATLKEAAAGYEPRRGAIGCFLLGVPTEGESRRDAARLAREAAGTGGACVVAGVSPAAWDIPAAAAELAALEIVRDTNPELRGDRVARTEVRARLDAVRERLEHGLARAFDTAKWVTAKGETKSLSRAGLNSLASDLATNRFSDAPEIRNELVNRAKPSSSAVAARNALMRLMAEHEHEERLGIEGFPAHGGLYDSLLKASGLHQQTDAGWRFVSPDADRQKDPCYFAPVWEAARDVVKRRGAQAPVLPKPPGLRDAAPGTGGRRRTAAVPLTRLYEVWREPPYGVKEGLLPVLAIAFLQSEKSRLALYRENVFQSELSSLFVDYLLRSAADIQVRWIDRSHGEERLLQAVAAVVRDFGKGELGASADPLEVARGLVEIHDALPPWTRRTRRLSRAARRLRQLLKQAHDPNQLIFDDLPRVCGGESVGQGRSEAEPVAGALRDSMTELQGAYGAMIHGLRSALMAELAVHSPAPGMLRELRQRAANVRELGGDQRLEAFIVRLSRFEGTTQDVEGIAGMAAARPVQLWVDTDVDKATVELGEMAQRFVRAEAFAHVKGRRDKRHAMAVMVGLDGRPTALREEFAVSDDEVVAARAVASEIESVIRGARRKDRRVVLAALADVSARYLDGGDAPASSRSSPEEESTS